METLLVGCVLLALALGQYLVMFKWTRRVPSHWLLSDSWVANVHAPLMIAFVTFGLAYVTKFAIITIM